MIQVLLPYGDGYWQFHNDNTKVYVRRKRKWRVWIPLDFYRFYELLCSKLEKILDLVLYPLFKIKSPQIDLRKP